MCDISNNDDEMKQNLILELWSEIQKIKDLNALDRSLKDDLNEKEEELRYQVGSNQKEKREIEDVRYEEETSQNHETSHIIELSVYEHQIGIRFSTSIPLNLENKEYDFGNLTKIESFWDTLWNSIDISQISNEKIILLLPLAWLRVIWNIENMDMQEPFLGVLCNFVEMFRTNIRMSIIFGMIFLSNKKSLFQSQYFYICTWV
jgi:hypothetical protein